MAKKKTKKAPKTRKTVAKSATVRKKESSGLFTFRRYKKEEGGKEKKSKHPKLIVDKKEKTYGFMGLTSSPKRGNHKNIPLSKNPQKGREGESYIRNELRYDKVEYFSTPLPDYKLAKQDRQTIEEHLKKQKEKQSKDNKKKK